MSGAEAEIEGLPSAPPDDKPPVLSSHDREGYGIAQLVETDETEIIKQYAPMVKSLASHLKGRLPESILIEDLVQAGMIAILRLTRVGYLNQLGGKPLRNAIRNAMIDEARRETWAPVRTIRRAKTAALAMRAVEARLGRHASDEELAAELGLSLEDYHELLIELAGIRLLELDEIVENEGEDSPESALQRERITAALADAIESLPDREKLVVSLYYERSLNMDEVGVILGFDKSTVCRAHGRALLRLRSALDGWK
ncbi:MAG: sigma-70 family RNA polymerase sigma factor [Stellaceae bacterium]